MAPGGPVIAFPQDKTDVCQLRASGSDLYETNEPGFWRADCVMWVDGKPQEPTLHVELSRPDGELRLRHNYIGA